MSAREHFRLTPGDFAIHARGLRRPECVLATPSGAVFASDAPDGVCRIDPDGTLTRLGAIAGVPNGFALDPAGGLLVTDIENGRLWRIAPDGTQALVLDRLAGAPLGAVNFVLVDGRGEAWVSVSTRTAPRALALSEPRPDGYILRIGADGPRLVADGLYFANELRLDRARRFLYVAETAQGRILRLPLTEDGGLGAPETFGPAPLFPGARVDGIAFDQEGNLWVTEIARNGLHLIRPDGSAHCVFEDPAGTVLPVPTSLAFGGADLRTGYIGSLTSDRLTRFRSPVAGEPLSHWS